MQEGLIHIYCGDGKGKTTAAIGLALRAAGCNFRVVIVQFLKSAQTGELNILSQIPNIKVLRGNENCTFTFKMNEDQRKNCLLSHTAILNQAIELCNSGQVDMLILDEVIAAYNSELIDKEKLLCFLKNKPNSIEIIMTGRNPADELLEICNYISEIKKIKHPYDMGITARRGIEQ